MEWRNGVRSFQDLHGFDYKKFAKERLGVGKNKQNLLSWDDVSYYFGLGKTVHLNPRNMDDGVMTKELHQSLCKLVGEDVVETYFEGYVKPDTRDTRTADEKFVDDLAAIM